MTSKQVATFDTEPPGDQRVWEHDWAVQGDTESLAGDQPIVKMQKVATIGYQIRHTLAAGFTMGWPDLQANACVNSGMFTTTPLMR